MKTWNKLIWLIIGLIFQIWSTVAQTNLYKLIRVDQQRGAACLDGSPPGYYMHQGVGSNRTNYLIYFLGGGFCGENSLSTTLQSCYRSTFTKNGSSKYHPDTLDSQGLGIISTSKDQNWLFYDWTKFIVISCDGSAYVGYRENPISYRDRQLYFRGSRNVKQVFNHMNMTYHIYNADTIVLAGTSEGGLASFQWSNYLHNNANGNVYIFPDSGFFITNFYSEIVGKKLFREKAEPLLNLVFNKEQFPSTIVQCLGILGFDVVDCFNAANYAQFIKTPIFMVQSPYDEWAINNIVDAQCLTNSKAPYSLAKCNETTRKVIESYRQHSIFYFKIIKSDRKDVGIWSPACIQHGYQPNDSYNNTKYQVQGTNLMAALQNFIKNPKNPQWLLDQFPWPGNQGCSGLSRQNNRNREGL